MPLRLSFCGLRDVRLFSRRARPCASSFASCAQTCERLCVPYAPFYVRSSAARSSFSAQLYALSVRFCGPFARLCELYVLLYGPLSYEPRRLSARLFCGLLPPCALLSFARLRLCVRPCGLCVRSCVRFSGPFCALCDGRVRFLHPAFPSYRSPLIPPAHTMCVMRSINQISQSCKYVFAPRAQTRASPVLRICVKS